MKICENCLERNNNGATNCVICGETLKVEQSEPAVRRGPPPPPPPRPKDAPPPLFGDGPAASSVSEAELLDASGAVTTPYALVEPSPPPQLEAHTPTPPPEPIPPVSEPSADVAAPCPTAAAVPVPIEPAGLVAIEVYHDTEPRVVHRHLIVNDVTVVGREDPQRDVFPDLDLSNREGVSGASASREHLRLLRQGGQLFLFVYRGSTGTQINKTLVEESQYGKRLPVSIGDRIILGGKVRLKLVAG